MFFPRNLPLLILSLLLLQTSINALTSFRVGHQVSSAYQIEVDVLVDGFEVEEFEDLSYGETSEYVVFPDQEQYLLSVYIHGTDTCLYNQSTEFVSDAQSSWFLVQTPSGELAGAVYLSLDVEPTEFYTTFRVINFVPSENYVNVLVDGQLTFTTVGFGDDTNSQNLGAAVHSFEVINATQEATSLYFGDFTLTSGIDYTLIVNFVGGTTEYELTQLVDKEFFYETCQVRGVNSVPDAQTIKFQIGNKITLELAYSDLSDYQALELGIYTVNFYNSSDVVVATTSLSCQSSGKYSIIFLGDASLGEDFSGEVLTDSNYAPLYTDSTVRVVLLSPSPQSSPSVIFLDNINVGTVSYPDSSSYFSSEQTAPSLILVTSSLTLVNETLDLQLGTSFSVFVFGLVDSDENTNDYPITTRIAADFQSETYPTTTTTGSSTTGSTTGTSGGSDDDDDDGLSGGAIAGIVIGVLVGVALFGGLILCVVKRRNASQNDHAYSQFERK